MAFYTKSEARAAAQGTLQKSFKSSNQILNESIARSGDYDKYDIFLSHSSRDAELVLGVKTLLERQGLTVYVDWIDDPQLSRENVTKETAALLRQRMQQSRSLIFMATESASESKWMPWELGYFDGWGKGNVAILPLVDNAGSTFRGQQYLGLYPLVEKDTYRGSTATDVFVMDRGNRWTTLEKFAKGQPIWGKFG